MDRGTVRLLMESLNRDAERIARRFGLRYKSLEAERANVVSRYGVCYSDGAIRIRLRHATTGRPLKYSSLVNTLCHELAHLRHFDHGLRFRALYLQILEFARAEGIYRPGGELRSGVALRDRTTRPAASRADAIGPTQLPLF
jgi:predicted metal-dependent hydrolase